MMNIHLHLEQRLRKSGVTPLFLLHAFMPWTKTTLHLQYTPQVLRIYTNDKPEINATYVLHYIVTEQ
jgi:hypothetical protein